MSGLLGRLADLAGRTLATAREIAPPPAGDEQLADAPPEASIAPAAPLAGPREPRPASPALPEARDRASGSGGAAPAASEPREPGAARFGAAADGARPPMLELSPAPHPTEEGRTGRAARISAPKAEGGPPETDVVPIEPPATASASFRETSRHGNDAAQTLDRASTSESGAAPPAAAGADATARAAIPGLLRDVDIRVVPAVGAAPGAQAAPAADDALTAAKLHWRALGERLRASYPPTAGGEPEQAGNGEASARPEAAELPFTHRRALPAQGERGAEATQRRSEVIIRHLEIRIVAAANETAPAAENRPPAPDAGAWRTAARHYLRL